MEVRTAEMCQAKCDSEATCQSAVFVPKTSYCYLKADISTCVKSTGEDSYLNLVRQKK
jgi:hypothetical protein